MASAKLSSPAIDALVAELAELKARLHCAENVAFAADALLDARVANSSLAVEKLRTAMRAWNASRHPPILLVPITGD